MKWPPTDLQILDEIYRRYYAKFADYSKKSPNRATKVYVPINIEELAEHFGIDGDIVFGRLYYHLEPKYGFTQKDNSSVHFFTLEAGKDVHAVQFPLLAAVIAELREERKKHLLATWLSIAALVVSAISVGIALAQ